MPRLIDVRDGSPCPDVVRIRVGDVLVLHAMGARVGGGRNVLDVFGPLQEAALVDRTILAPIGTPNTVLLRAVAVGQTTVTLVTGTALQATGETSIRIVVD